MVFQHDYNCHTGHDFACFCLLTAKMSSFAFYGGQGNGMSFEEVLGLGTSTREELRSQAVALSQNLLNAAIVTDRPIVPQDRTTDFEINKRISQSEVIKINLTDVRSHLLPRVRGSQEWFVGIKEKYDVSPYAKFNAQFVKSLTVLLDRGADEAVVTSKENFYKYVVDLLYFDKSKRLHDGHDPYQPLKPYFPVHKVSAVWRLAVFTIPGGTIGVWDFVFPRSKFTVKTRLQEAQRIAKDYVLSSGTLSGQLGRLEKCFEVRQYVKMYEPVPDDYYSSAPEERRKLHDAVFPDVGSYTFFFLKGGFQNTPVPFFLTPTDLVASEGNELFNLLLSVNPTAESGLPYDGETTRRMTLPADLATSCALMTLFEDYFRSDKEKAEYLLEMMLRACICKCKPKNEITKLSDYLTKTRNIFVPPAYLMAHLGPFVSALMKPYSKPLECQVYRAAENQLEVAPSCSLYGFVPFFGGYGDVIGTISNRLRSKKWPLIPAFYSDNLYVAFLHEEDGFTIVSLDGSKMEASALKSDNAWIAEQVLRNCGYSPNSAMGRLITFSLTDLTNDAYAVLGKRVFKSPGLGSGVPNTFYNNHMRMARIARHIMTMDPKQVIEAVQNTPDDEEVFVNKVPIGAISHAKLERVVGTDRPPRHSMVRYVTWKEGLAKAGPMQFPAEVCVRTDILGFDTCFYMVNEIAKPIPVLNYERLVRAIAFRKSDESTLFKKEKWYEELSMTVKAWLVNIIHLCTVVNLYSIGGFSYAFTHEWLNALANYLAVDIRMNLKTRNPDDAVPLWVNTLMVAKKTLEFDMKSIEMGEQVVATSFLYVQDIIFGDVSMAHLKPDEVIERFHMPKAPGEQPELTKEMLTEIATARFTSLLAGPDMPTGGKRVRPDSPDPAEELSSSKPARVEIDTRWGQDKAPSQESGAEESNILFGEI